MTPYTSNQRNNPGIAPLQPMRKPFQLLGVQSQLLNRSTDDIARNHSAASRPEPKKNQTQQIHSGKSEISKLKAQLKSKDELISTLKAKNDESKLEIDRLQLILEQT